MPRQYLQAFKDGFNGGTRANRFLVEGNWPDMIGTQPPTRFHVFSAQIPQFSVGTITMPHRGRNLYLGGDREVQPWPIMVYDDTGNRNLWKAFSQWNKVLNDPETNRVFGNEFSYPSQELTAGRALLTTWTFRQLAECGTVLKVIDLYRAWPAIVPDIELDMGNGSPVTFQVTMSYDYATVRDL